MAKFIYKAKSGPKSIIEGTMDAESQSAVLQQLGKLGYFPIKVESAETGVTSGATRDHLNKKISGDQMSLLFRQLSDLLEAGLPLVSVLKMTARQTSDKSLMTIMKDMADSVEEGETLSSAMRKYSGVFPPYYTHLVYAGETGGMLGKVLTRLAETSENEVEIKSKIKAAIAYPLFIVIVGILVIGFLLGVIIPKLAAMFTEFRHDLPLPTRILLAISGFLSGYWWTIPVIITLIYGIAQIQGDKWNLKLKRDELLIKIPVLSRWIQKREIARFTRTFGSLLQNGVPLIESLEVSIQTMGNMAYKKQLASIKGKVQEGELFSRCLGEIPLFSEDICNLIAVGEEGGKLDSALIKIGESYDRQAERELKVLVSLLEPVLILAVGLILGGIVISVMLPIFDINTLIR